MESKPVKKVKITINGRELEVPSTYSVIKAADEAGIAIPRYCYHEDLAIAGVCRMCVCEVEKNPRLQISCNTPVADGMVVKTDTDKVKDAVKSALELHLINHPLDCPICDKAGECKLQDLYAGHGLYKSRMDMDEKVHKPKVKDIGTIRLDSERCILCTRCVRFTSDVTKTNELTILNRGDRSELTTYDNGKLENDYTGNLADICPVGALTAKDFRFKQRVWFLDKTKSICTLCARGCNTVVSYNPATKNVYRVEPRRNPEVNSSWMCDEGRWGYHHLYEQRVKVPMVRVNPGAGLVESTWHEAYVTAAETLRAEGKKVWVALSTQMTNEELSDCVTSLKQLGVENFTWIVDEKAAAETTPYDGLLRHRDLTPNAAGFKIVMNALGVKWMDHATWTAAMKKEAPSAVWFLGLEGFRLEFLKPLWDALPASTKILVHSTSESPLWERATWVLPNQTSFEKTGTMVNALGRLQKVNAAIPAQHTARDAHQFAWGVQKAGDREKMPADRPLHVFEGLFVQKLWKRPVSFKKFALLGLRADGTEMGGVDGTA